MSVCVRLLVFAMVTALATASGENSTQRVRSKVTRTSLHVARSLDPSESEFVHVKTKTGEMATLIVKKRTGKNSSEAEVTTETLSKSQIKNSNEFNRQPKTNLLPLPVEIRSDVVFVKDSASPQKKKSRHLSLENGVPVIEGVREPDTPEDKIQTWRNAKVINGVLVPHKQSLNSEIPLKPGSEGKEKLEKQEVLVSSYFETKEKPSMFGINDAIKTQWKGISPSAAVSDPGKSEEKFKPIPIIFHDQDKSHAKIIEYINKINQKEVQSRRKSGRSVVFDDKSEAKRRMDENVDENEEPIWVNTQLQEIWTEDGKISVADRRMDTGLTDDYDRSDKFIPITPVQARLLQPQGVSNYPTSTIYSSQPSRVSFEKGVRTPVLQYAHPELGAQPAKVEREVEDIELTKSRDSSIPALTYFLNDPYADRSPYAYEPGLTSHSDDSIASNSEISNSIGGPQHREGLRRQSVRHIEFTTSLPESSSINPDEIDITESPTKTKTGSYFSDGYGSNYDNYLQSYQHFNYPSKYSMSKEDYYKWKMSGMTYGNSHSPTGYLIKIPDNRPFWEKITDTIKETVQSGVESMKEITRPVMEPLVEATQRISENLGIPEATAKISNTLGFNQGVGMRTALQEKIGAAASTNPVLLPALGLVGAGAALGLGAVAVGRLLDVHVPLLKRSGEDELNSQLFSEQRALSAVERLENVSLPANESTEEGSRTAKFLPLQNKTTEKESKNELKRLIDESGIEELEKFHFDLSESSDENKSRRRSLVSKKEEQDANQNYLDKVQKGKIENFEEFSSKLKGLELPSSWRNVPCAQKIFCEALARESTEKVDFVSERVVALADENSTSSFVRPVLAAAKTGDCSSFACHETVRR